VVWEGKTYKPLADGKYDCIILGTGLKECVLSGLLAWEWSGMRIGMSRALLALKLKKLPRKLTRR
jgi:hypothetical protein